MKYTKYTIKTTTKDADMVSALLMDYDINDIQIENNVQLTDEELKQIHADFVKELPPDDGSCSVSFFIEFDENGVNRAATEKKMEELEKYLIDSCETFSLEPIELIKTELESEDWEGNWKKYFQPFQVEDILIAPTWVDVNNISEVLSEVPGYVSENKTRDISMVNVSDIKTIIKIDPGMAFGTGTHETTRLCLKALRKYLKPGDKVLDLGCGSGILGIGAIKMNAASITSVDIDAQAVEIAKENFAINEVSSDISSFYVGDVVTNEALKNELGTGYDVVVVNILAEVINMMLPTLDTYLKKDGILIMSGILESREQLIKDAIKANPNLTYLETTHDREWVRITAQRI